MASFAKSFDRAMAAARKTKATRPAPGGVISEREARVLGEREGAEIVARISGARLRENLAPYLLRTAEYVLREVGSGMMGRLVPSHNNLVALSKKAAGEENWVPYSSAFVGGTNTAISKALEDPAIRKRLVQAFLEAVLEGIE